jgi:hypothetical protein
MLSIRAVGRSDPMATLLDVKDLRTRFHTPEGTVYAVNGISFHVDTDTPGGDCWWESILQWK